MFLVATICVPLFGGSPLLLCNDRYIPMYGASEQECVLGAQQVLVYELKKGEILKRWRCEK